MAPLREIYAGEPKVLLLDDQPTVRMLMERWLNHSGISTLSTGDEEEAFKLLQRPDVKMLIQDFARGEGTRGGFRFLQWMRGCERTKDIPVVIVTGTSVELIKRVFSEHQLSIEDELFSLLVKPMPPCELEALAKAIRKRFESG